MSTEPRPVLPYEWANACARSQVRSEIRRPYRGPAAAPRRPMPRPTVAGARRALSILTIAGAVYSGAAATVLLLTP